MKSLLNARQLGTEVPTISVGNGDMEVSQNCGYHFWGPYKGYSISGSILGYTNFGKVPNGAIQYCCYNLGVVFGVAVHQVDQVLIFDANRL